MESYKRVVLSLTLLLSTPLSTFCMEGIGTLDDGVNLGAAASNSIIPAGASFQGGADLLKSPAIGDHNHALLSPGTPASNNPPNTPVSPVDISAFDDGDEIFYTPRASIKYIGLENFDKRSVDDLTQDQAFQALLLQIQAASITPTSTSNIPAVPEIVMGAGAVGVLANALTTAAPAVRGIFIDSKSFGVSAGEAAWSILTQNGFQLATFAALLTIIFETRKTAQVEERNKKLMAQLAAYKKSLQEVASVNKRHELVEHGLIATEHKLLTSVHNYLCEEAGLIAKGSAPTQAVATLQTILAKNKKVTKKVVLAMADLEKIHTDSASLLQDANHYSMLNPMGWFHALKNMCAKHSADADAADAATK